MTDSAKRSVLVTGAAGYIGREVVHHLARASDLVARLVALDVRPPSEADRLEGVDYVTADVRDPAIVDVLRQYEIDTLVHLATIVTPGKQHDREFEHSVDVLGTRNVIEACLVAGVRHVIVTSSGAAYGYHADNPQPLGEDDAIRGNREFAYSDHKRQVEEMLAHYRAAHPELKQLVLRPGTVLGERTRNQITDLFDKRLVLGLWECEIPFVFIWDQDVAACVVKGVEEGAEGIYNLAGDGALSLKEVARLLGKPYIPIPVPLLKTALWVLRAIGATQYGPEQVDFLRYRPVLSNERLKRDFGYKPRYTSRETFEFFLEHRRSEAGHVS